MAVIDELAAAGELVKGKCDQVPVAVVRGYPGRRRTTPRAPSRWCATRPADMFSLGTAEARAAGLRAAATLPDATPLRRRSAAAGCDPGRRARSTGALATVATVVAPGTPDRPAPTAAARCDSPPVSTAAGADPARRGRAPAPRRAGRRGRASDGGSTATAASSALRLTG